MLPWLCEEKDTTNRNTYHKQVSILYKNKGSLSSKKDKIKLCKEIKDKVLHSSITMSQDGLRDSKI
jgi:hypothetical protein